MTTPKKTPAAKTPKAEQAKATTQATTAPATAEERAVAPALPRGQAAKEALPGVEAKPTMVNGVSVAGKVYDEESDTWVADEAATAQVRAADIFDRIGDAFPHERQRLVIEELARHIGLTDQATDMPDGMPNTKSTASLRTDVSGHGRFASGGEGTRPVDAPTGEAETGADVPPAPTE